MLLRVFPERLLRLDGFALCKLELFAGVDELDGNELLQLLWQVVVPPIVVQQSLVDYTLHVLPALGGLTQRRLLAD